MPVLPHQPFPQETGDADETWTRAPWPIVPHQITVVRAPERDAPHGPLTNLWRWAVGVLSRLRTWWSQEQFPAPEPGPQKAGRWFWVGLLFLALLAGLLLFPRLSYPLLEPDEGRRAEIGREMLTGGDWLLPTLNGEPYYDKPPLFHWLLALCFRCFGTSPATARLVPATIALLTILATFLFGRRLLGTRAAFLAALALMLMVGFALSGRLLGLDGLLTLCVSLALLTAYRAVRGPRLRWGWWLASAVCTALGLLTKGPVAYALFVPPLVVHLWLYTDQARLRWTHWLAHAGLALGLVAPWYVAATVRDPEFAYQFFVYHHVNRFLSGSEHDEPFWYYAPVLVLGCLPGSFLTVPYLRFLASRCPTVRPLRTRPLSFLLLWAGWCILFFSLSRGKLPLYLLPALPALALLVGAYLDLVIFRGAVGAVFRWARTLLPLVAAGTLAVGWLILGVGFWQTGALGGATLLAEAGACVLGLTAVIVWRRMLSIKAAWAVCATVMAALLFDGGQHLLPALAEQRFPLQRPRAVAALLRDGPAAVISHGQQWGSLSFLAGGDVFNLERRPPGDLTAFLRAHKRALLVTASCEWPRLRSTLPAGIQSSLVGESGCALLYLLQHSAGCPCCAALNRVAAAGR
jgi:dolichol-phosphate mannosyltransferase